MRRGPQGGLTVSALAAGDTDERGGLSPMKSKLFSGLAIAAIASTALASAAGAQWIDTASGGNGGVSTADSSGGAVTIGSTNSGGSTGVQTAIDNALVSGDDIAQAVIAAIYGGQ